MDLSGRIGGIAKGAGFFAKEENLGLEKGDSRNWRNLSHQGGRTRWGMFYVSSQPSYWGKDAPKMPVKQENFISGAGF